MKEWLSLRSVSKEYADLSERTLRGFLTHPVHPLPARLVGGKWLICKRDLDDWMQNFPRSGEKLDRLVDEVLIELQGGGDDR